MAVLTIKKDLDYALYNSLTLEDRKIIEEYIPKMSFDDINSFMKRLVEHYVIEVNKEIFEVQEDIDTVIAFEHYDISKYSNSINNDVFVKTESPCADKKNITYLSQLNSAKIKIPYERIFGQLNKQFLTPKKQKSYLALAIKSYFLEEYNKDIELLIKNFHFSSLDIQYMRNFDNYLLDAQLQCNLQKIPYRIGWVVSDKIKDCIRERYVDIAKTNERYMRKIIAKLPLCFYVYRKSNDNKKMRIGIAIDVVALPATKYLAAGFSRNSKIDTKFISLMCNNEDLTPFIKYISYWSPENAKIHGFDGRTGIIWFEGKKSGEQWEFPNGMRIDHKSIVLVKAFCIPDSFFKMYQRLDINNKIQNIISDLEIDAHL
jgi:hypothetical protein